MARRSTRTPSCQDCFFGRSGLCALPEPSPCVTFRPYHPDQALLLPPLLQDWLPEGHLASFVSDVVDALDLSPILGVYARQEGRGQPPYHPRLMVKLLVYGYCTGVISSSKMPFF